MGICINWTLRAPENAAAASVEARLHTLRQACLDLPFDKVTDVVYFEEADIVRRLDARADPFRWLLVQASVSRPIDPADPDEGWISIDPVAVMGFTAYAGKQCEPMNCFLARYPEQVVVGGHLMRPKIEGWRGSAFAKTQYASTVTAQHFLKCHLTITAALDAAKAAGLLESVLDETGYWDDRNVEKLLTTVGQWNATMAAVVGGLEQETARNLQAPIKQHPEFDRLEHVGTTADTAAMAKAIAAMLKHTDPGQ